MRRLKIPAHHLRPATLRRYHTGQYVNGVWEEGFFQDSDVNLSVQPARSAYRHLAEGNEGQRLFEVYSNFPLNDGNDGQRPDEVFIDGRWLVLREIVDWQHRGFTHAVFMEKKEL